MHRHNRVDISFCPPGQSRSSDAELAILIRDQLPPVEHSLTTELRFKLNLANRSASDGAEW